MESAWAPGLATASGGLGSWRNEVWGGGGGVGGLRAWFGLSCCVVLSCVGCHVLGA